MNALLLSLILLGQSITQAPADGGTVTGVIRTASGAPAVGIRVAAMARPETPADAATEISSGSLAQTDEQGRYRLENIPPGTYYIAAGRVSLPTYFPGTLEMVKGKSISITPAAVVNNIDIVMDDASIRPPDSAMDVSAVAGLTMPVQVRMEGGKQPVFANGRAVMVRFTRKQDGAVSESPLNAPVLNLAVPNSLPGNEYRVTIENLPAGYAVKSMTQDRVNLLNDTLKITAKNFIEAPIPVYGAALPGAMLDKVRMAYGAGGPMIPLEITLAGTAPNPVAGVRVQGKVASAENWDLSLMGSSAILFADGTFEYRGVAPGRHIFELQNKFVEPARVLAASIVVGDKDLNDVVVEDTVVLPVEIRFPAGTRPPGTVPLASIRGRVVDDGSKGPVAGGSVTIAGTTKAMFSIDSEGLFQIPSLLPGTYDLTIEGLRHAAIHQNVVVGDEDVNLNASVRRVD